ncbi:hypothetical protein CYLTODRAFT_425381 [Cylindrobasidium torrendii FP15055 ss-10]|uniref:Uncharacterized protein n=1 Tax=Cylindrobasidium torrendii FP15055 ss-10 TaxID=1314674 RepID=A0A0D7B274_9AGAR|nr:hypothetical protein CYLTODRAFT_425381 [Cylindrobasidium torrendii FP15055 ss-10]
MHVRYTEDCISTSLSFGATTAYKIIGTGENRAIRTHGRLSGIGTEEFRDRIDKDSMNQLHLQPTTHHLFRTYKLALRPTPSSLTALSDLYMSNARLPPLYRRRFDDVTELHGAPHTLEVRKGLEVDLFLKHPVTGEITVHQRPYANLPLFYPRTAHPVATNHNAFSFLVAAWSGMWILDSLCVAIRECEKVCNATERSFGKVGAGAEKSAHQETKTLVRKRKASGDQDAPCTKHFKCQEMLDAAQADAIARQTLAAPIVATLPSRQRKALCQDGPHSKRTRCDLANS